MQNNILIPKKVKVGFQNRYGTYTGKLAYVIYYDENNKLRKEKSWNSWRDKNIEPEEFENIPISGFVLNKKVGDYSSDWNHRQAYCRVYDPRGFEFEITIDNLLYILENANSIKGKGLEGEFVYGWSGKDLILMPVDAPDYKEVIEYSSLIERKEYIKPKELKIGATYLSKQNEELVYMGKYTKYNWNGNALGEYFWFATNTLGWYFMQYKSITKKLIKCIDEDSHPEYAEIFEEMEESSTYSPIDNSKDEYVKYSLEEFISALNNRRWSFFSPTGIEYSISEYSDNKANIYTNTYTYEHNTGFRNFVDSRFNITKERRYSGWAYGYYYVMELIDIEELYQKAEPCYRIKHLQNNKEYRRENYYE